MPKYDILLDLHDPDLMCPACGAVLELETFSEGDDADGNRGWVQERYTCPRCGEVG